MKTAEEWVNSYILLEKEWTNSSLVNLVEQVQQDARKELEEENKQLKGLVDYFKSISEGRDRSL